MDINQAIQNMTDMHKLVLRQQNEVLEAITPEQIAEFDAALVVQHNKMMARKYHKSWLLSQWIRQTGGHLFTGQALKQMYLYIGGNYKSNNLYCLLTRQLDTKIGSGLDYVQASKYGSWYSTSTIFRYNKLKEVQSWLNAIKYKSNFNHW